jgi:hypothetical protein
MHTDPAVIRVGRRPADGVAAPGAVVPHLIEIPDVARPAAAAHKDLVVLLPGVTAVVVLLIARGDRLLRLGHVLASLGLGRRDLVRAGLRGVVRAGLRGVVRGGVGAVFHGGVRVDGAAARERACQGERPGESCPINAVGHCIHSNWRAARYNGDLVR